MPSHGREISYELRCCVICLHSLLPPPQNTFLRIGHLLDLSPGTCQRIWQRARQRAGNSQFKEVLACVGNLERSGRPARIVDGTTESAQLRSLIMNLDDQQFSEVSNIWQQMTGETLHTSIIDRVARTHRDKAHNYAIVRRTRPLIPSLRIQHFNDRDIFCQWAILRVRAGAIFIFTDESMVEVGGPPRSKPRISRPRGQVDTFERALPISKVQFKMMIWAAICVGWEGEFPIFCWSDSIEDDEAKQANSEELALENQLRRANIEASHLSVTQVSDSVEARALQEINGNIQRENTRRAEIGQRGRLHKKTVQQVFPYEDLKRDHKKNGIDWFLYRQKV